MAEEVPDEDAEVLAMLVLILSRVTEGRRARIVAKFARLIEEAPEVVDRARRGFDEARGVT